jgi:hypothetical protein
MNFPIGETGKMHLILILTLVVVVFFLMPVQEKIEAWVFKKFLSEYYIDEYNEIQLAGRVVGLKDLIFRVFPDMVNMSGAKKGKLYILKKSRVFDAYAIADGRPRKIKNQSIHIDPKLLVYLKETKSPIYSSDAERLSWLEKVFMDLKSEFILPLLYREKIFGFITLSSIPPTNRVFNLKVLASKAAISVYNNILSTQVADLNLYKKEIEKANRIQGMVFNTRIPRLSGMDVKLINKVQDIILEFIPGENGEYVMIAIALTNPKFGGGLVLSHILGKLYSFFIIKKNLNHKVIKEFVEEGFEDLNWKEGYEMVVGIIQPELRKIIFNQVGTQFKVTDDESDDMLISVGWRCTIEIKESTIYLFYRNQKILSIRDLAL